MNYGIIECIILILVGAAGTSIYVFIVLITNKDVSVITSNNIIGTKSTVILYILIGGLVTWFYSMSLNVELSASEIWKVLILGIGWQALIASYTTLKKAEDGEKSPQYTDIIKEKEKEIEKLRTQLFKSYKPDR